MLKQHSTAQHSTAQHSTAQLKAEQGFSALRFSDRSNTTAIMNTDSCMHDYLYM